MTAHEFITCIRLEVLEANLATYQQNLECSFSTTNGQHTRWPRMAALYQSLTEDQQHQFMESVRQVMLDTLSNVFGILDGSTLLEKHRDYFHVTYSDEPKELNGELQEIFLSSEN